MSIYSLEEGPRFGGLSVAEGETQSQKEAQREGEEKHWIKRKTGSNYWGINRKRAAMKVDEELP